jgi:hypothetical protein
MGTGTNHAVSYSFNDTYKSWGLYKPPINSRDLPLPSYIPVESAECVVVASGVAPFLEPDQPITHPHDHLTSEFPEWLVAHMGSE